MKNFLVALDIINPAQDYEFASQIFNNRQTQLGIKVGTADLAQPKPADRYEIDSVVTGAYHTTPMGDVFVAVQSFLPDYLHGQSPVAPASPFPLVAQWANDPRLADYPLEAFAFLDTETSGLAGGTGTYAFLVGVGRFIEGGYVLQQFFMRDPAEEPALHEGLAAFLARRCSTICHHFKRAGFH